MSENNITLVYKNTQKIIEIPKNFEELQEVFFKEFKEDKKKNIYFCYKQLIDSEIDFQQLIKENPKMNINAFEGKKEKKTIDIKKDEVIKEKNEPKEKEINDLKDNNDILNLEPLKEIVNDAYNFDGVVNAFTAFNSIDNILYVVYATRFKSIISFNLTDSKKIKEITNAHDDKITNFRHIVDETNKRDLVISISCPINNIKLWDVKNLELLYNFEKIYESGTLRSGCFLKDKNDIFIVTSNSNNVDKCKLIKVYDLKGNEIKEINNSKDDTYFIDCYNDNKNNKSYIITGNFFDVKSYDFNDNNIYKKYSDQFSKVHSCVIINDKDKENEEVELIESCKDGSVRIFKFHTGELLKRIEVSKNTLFELCLWNNESLFVGCGEEIIKLIDIKKGKVIKTLTDFNSVIGLKKLIHPQHGECLLSQGNEIEQIMLWVMKKN